MEVLTFLIAVAALVIALVAFARTGGIADLRRQVEGLSADSKTVRERTADALARVERLVRGGERPPGASPEAGPGSPPPHGDQDIR